MIDDMDELHSKLSILGAIDVGIVVVDNDNNIQKLVFANSVNFKK